MNNKHFLAVLSVFLAADAGAINRSAPGVNLQAPVFGAAPLLAVPQMPASSLPRLAVLEAMGTAEWAQASRQPGLAQSLAPMLESIADGKAGAASDRNAAQRIADQLAGECYAIAAGDGGCLRGRRFPGGVFGGGFGGGGGYGGGYGGGQKPPEPPKKPKPTPGDDGGRKYVPGVLRLTFQLSLLPGYESEVDERIAGFLWTIGFPSTGERPVVSGDRVSVEVRVPAGKESATAKTLRGRYPDVIRNAARVPTAKPAPVESDARFVAGRVHMMIATAKLKGRGKPATKVASFLKKLGYEVVKSADILGDGKRFDVLLEVPVGEESAIVKKLLDENPGVVIRAQRQNKIKLH